MHGDELCIELRNPLAATTDVCEGRYEYTVDLGEGDARPRPLARLLDYARRQLDMNTKLALCETYACMCAAGSGAGCC